MQENSYSILIADDDIDDLEVLNDALARLAPSVKVIFANSGKEAVSMLTAWQDGNLPNLILLDYNMPDLTGAEVLNVISGDKRYDSTPKVIWSTSDTHLYEQICRNSGATHYFRKPDSAHAILSFAKQLLSLNK